MDPQGFDVDGVVMDDTRDWVEIADDAKIRDGKRRPTTRRGRGWGVKTEDGLPVEGYGSELEDFESRMVEDGREE